MAQEEVILKLSAEIGDLKKELETVKKGVEGIGDSAKATEKNTGKLAKGIKGVGLAFKAAGIALILQGFELLKDLFMQNQKVADGFAIAFEAVSIAMNDFINFTRAFCNGFRHPGAEQSCVFSIIFFNVFPLANTMCIFCSKSVAKQL